ncbi:hypothetical protein GH714_028123 [Hevea brasiliensis]|uniref:Uncharacterized protein n=1 Tax=Hevea brasiliensis TaxID=3981 RepID=A0A6A6LUI3_HEVBR|nr:hypothetical protein GH714_028123 [Hevea brasiliensis]
MAKQNHLLVSKIGIIGAGVSGLAALKQLSHQSPVVFEASDSLEGDDPSFPSHTEILDYLNSYAERFDLFKYVRLNSKVVEVRFIGDRETADFSGNYGSLLPVSRSGRWPCKAINQTPFRGPEIFEGQVLHSLDYCKLDKEAASQLLKGKKVAVVGFKKSAIDLALECAEANQGPDGQPCTMVVRTLHWTVPHYWKYGLKPDHPFIEDYASCQMAIMPENFFPEVDKGKIQFKRTSKFWFSREGLEFEDNTKLKADVVILATGYDGKKKLKNILPKPFYSLLEYPYGVMPLYRGTIHPLIPNMAFVGYIESVANLHTAELRSMWLARLVDNNLSSQLWKSLTKCPRRLKL